MKRFANWIFFIVCLCLLLPSCTDEEISMSVPEAGRVGAGGNDDKQKGGLQLDDYGRWVASERVPLVGIGRVVNNIAPGLVSVAGSQSGFANITNLDLTDAASLSGLEVNLLGNQILSVKDIYRKYAGGQTVGFVLGANEGGVLSLDVLQLFAISLYNDGKLVHTYNAKKEGETLALNLFSIGNTGEQALSILADKSEVPEFDEIMLATTGVSANLGKVKIHYAFVGETPIHEVTASDDPEPIIYDAKIPDIIDGSGNTNDAENLLTPGDNYEGCYLDIGTVVVKPEHYVDVDLGTSIPVGTEVGFTYEQGSALNLSLFHEISFATYDASGAEKDKFSSSSLLGLSVVAGGKGAYSLVAKESGAQRFRITSGANVGLDAGAMRLLRAYTRKAVAIDPTSYFTTPKEITTPNSFYKFVLPDEGRLTLASAGGVTINGSLVTGMKYGESYPIIVTYRGPDGRSFTMDVTIKCESRSETECTPTYLTEENHWELAEQNDVAGVEIISLSGNGENIVDNDRANYAYNTTVINLLEHGVLAAVKHNGGAVNREKEKLRVGFTIQNGSELLGVNALKFFSVKLYKNGTEVGSNVSVSNQGVSLGLLNGSRNKLRVSIETEEEFDCVALCTAGLLGVSLNTLRIYYAFYENADNCESGEGTFDACSEIMTPINSNLRINYDWTNFSSLATAVSSFNNLGNILDDDPTNGAVVPVTVQAIGDFTIGFQFNEKRAGEWIGLMMQRPTGLADVQVLSMLSFDIMKGDNVVQTIRGDQEGLLGLNALGFDEKIYLEAYPKYDFDGIKVNVFSLATVLEDYVFYGVYGLGDANGNGIPDCSEGDEDDGGTDVIYPDKYRYDVCKPDALVINLQGGVTGQVYTLTFAPMTGDSGTEKIEVSIEMPANRRISIPTVTDTYEFQAIGYYLNITRSDGTDGDYPNNIEVYIHPKTSTWKGGAEDAESDWNTASNWSEGVPWTCTDVLIPVNCTYYPILKSGTDYYCNRIQFEPGAEVVNTHYLHYESAWVNVALKAGEYNMFAAPLKEMYTGDMFYIDDEDLKGNGITGYETCWLDYVEKDYEVNRFIPKVYQRMWNRSVQNAVNDKNGYVTVDLDDDSWTAPFNLVSQLYEAGQGILVRPGKEGATGSGTVDTGDGTTGTGSTTTDGTLVFRFPKRYDTYQYYDLETTEAMSNRWETLTRNAADVGRFIYENASGSITFPYHVLLENKRPGDVFLAGNPFMAHINVGKFFELNPAVQEIRFLRKNGDTYSYDRWNKNDPGSDVENRQIAPMQSFLVVVADAYKDMYRYQLNIHYVEEMLEMKKQ